MATEERAREVLAERADAEGLAGRAEWLRAGCPVRADQWPSDDEAERVKVAAQVADMLALADEVRQDAAKRLERRAGEWRSSMIGRTVQQCQVPLRMIDELHEQAAAIRAQGGVRG